MGSFDNTVGKERQEGGKKTKNMSYSQKKRGSWGLWGKGPHHGVSRRGKQKAVICAKNKYKEKKKGRGRSKGTGRIADQTKKIGATAAIVPRAPQ